MSRFIALGLLFVSLCAHAAGPVVDTVGGASGFALSGTNNATVNIFGGIGGETCDVKPTDPAATCTSCDATTAASCGVDSPLCPCNPSRIWDGMIMRINFKDDAANNYNIVAQNVTSTTGTNFPPVTSANGGSFADFRWTDICTAMGHVTCEDAKNATAAIPPFTLRVGFDKNADGQFTSGEEYSDITIKLISPPATFSVVSATNLDGLDGFKPYPGDEKIILEEPHTSGNYPTLSYPAGGSRARKVHVFFSDTTIDNATPYRTEFDPVDLPLKDDTSGDFLETPVVDGLDNDKPYYFRVALMDEANNIVQFFPDNLAGDASAGAGPCTGTTPDPANCPYAATPSQVLGLLSKDMNCFIATAAYGSPLDAHINTFREFRHVFLLRNIWGRKFVTAYYEYGPYAARFIQDKPWVRATARVFLWPLYAFSYSALKFGFAVTFATTLLLLSSMLALPCFGFRRWRSDRA